MPQKSAHAIEQLRILSKIAHLEDEDRQPAYQKTADNAPVYDGRDLPVVAVAVYRSDVLVIRQGDTVKSGQKSRRGDIKEMSDESLRRLAFLANNSEQTWGSMVTLTYPSVFPTDGKIVKRHLAAMLRSFKRRLGHITYIWFLEFQQRGAAHIHILLTTKLTPSITPDLHSWLSQRWYNIVGSGDEKHLLAGTNWENTRTDDGLRRYVVKYAFKTWQKEVPVGFRQVGRFWGASRDVVLEPIAIEVSDEEKVRAQLCLWPYKAVLESKIPRVLYSASEFYGKH